MTLFKQLGYGRSGMIAIGAGFTILLAACGSSGHSDQTVSSGLPSRINLYSIQPLSGPIAFVGKDIQQGEELAISDINKQHFLGSTQLSISYGDTGGTAATAASLSSEAVQKNYPVIFGSPDAAEAVAMSPVFQRTHQVAIYTQSGGNGVILGNSIFRMTDGNNVVVPPTLSWLQSKGVKSVGLLYGSDDAALISYAADVRSDAPKYGLKIVGQTTVLSTETDISGSISKLLSAHPQAVAMYLRTTQNATAASELAQQGFKGKIIAQSGAGSGGLTGAGAAGNGVVWATDWADGISKDAMSTTFASEFEAKYKVTPTNYSAEAYDAVWFAARGLKLAKSVDSGKLASALATIGSQGFTGVVGPVKVVNGQEQSTPVVVQWQNGNIVPLPGK